jgi:hypothetical protein
MRIFTTTGLIASIAVHASMLLCLDASIRFMPFA